MGFVSRLLVSAAVVGGGVWLLRSRREDVRHLVVERVLERPTRAKRYAELADDLYVAGERLGLRLQRTRPGAAASGVMRHIIGIERWGQSRLRVAFGEPFVRDAHQPYKPPREATWEELTQDFHDTRAETVAIARGLSSDPPPPDWRVEHNALGPLSARAWLRYLQLHADLESRKLR